MSWIQDNKFLAGLAGVTFVAAAGLLYFGNKGATAYDEAKMSYDEAAAEIQGFETLALYPKKENLDGKRKALDDYRQATESLQKAFDPFRKENLESISPQEFTTRLRAADAEVRKAFEESNIVLPAGFFMGFESYSSGLAPGGATGILDYQLKAMKEIMLQLAEASPMELKNLHRPKLQEENGQSFEPQPMAVARQLPLEITFKGSEKSVREFLSAIAKTENRYAVIRSLRISNEKKTPPKSSDAKFEAPPAAVDPEGIFGVDGFFNEPTAENDGEAEEPEDAPDAPDAPAAPVAPVAPADSSRMLAQVLGQENLVVFLRLDLLLFLPAKELPKP